jgi:chitin disaccharide deacetylase
MALSRLIVNADDFGYSEAVNRAILMSFDYSLVNSTSLMANMPGFDHAIGLFHQHSHLQQKVGLHLNLTEGAPLTRGMLACPVFCRESGHFRYDRGRSLFRLGRREREAVYEEFRAQLERVLAAGVRPTHLDSHHHIHTEWAIAPLVCRLAGAYGVPRIRLTRNMGLVPGLPRRLYKKVFNRWWLGRRSGLVNTDYFGDIADMMTYLAGRRQPDERLSFEIMVHPLLDERGRLVDLDRKDLQQELLPVLRLAAAEPAA